MVSAGILLVAIVVILSLVPRTKPRSTEYTGYSTFTGAHINLPAPCAESRADEAEILVALGRHDLDGVAGLSARKGIPILPVGTTVDGEYGGDETERLLSHVTVKSGYYVGTSCWIYTQAMHTVQQ